VTDSLNSFGVTFALTYHKRRLTTRRAGDIAPIRKKGCLNFLYVPSQANLTNCFEMTNIAFLALAIQLPLLFLAAQKAMYSITSDGIAYLRIAKYYAEGRFDLAVNGYWSPLLSWIMVALPSFSENPIVAGRIAMAFSAVVYLLGSIKLIGTSGVTQTEALLASIVIALFSISWSVYWILPDLLMSGLMLIGLGYMLDHRNLEATAKSFLSGLLFGLAYLAKAVALPISLSLITFLAISRLVSKPMDAKLIVKAAAWNLTGFVFCALPWIVVLSYHYGKPTFSTSLKINHALVGPGDPEDCAVPHFGCSRFHPHVRGFHVPDPDRVTSWEEPSQLTYKYWSPFENLNSFIHQVKVIWHNAFVITKIIVGFDSLALGFTAMIAGFLLPITSVRDVLDQTWRLAAPITAIFVVFYLPVYATEARYYLSCYPIILAAALRFWMDLSKGNIPIPEYRFTTKRGAICWRQTLALLIILGSFFPNVYDLKRVLREGNANPSYVFAKDLSPKLSESVHRNGAIGFVGTPAGVAIHAAFLTGFPFYGGHKQPASSDEIIQSGAEFLIVDTNSTTAFNLEGNPAFELLDDRIPDLRTYQRVWRH
jgi:hypothetical protein